MVAKYGTQRLLPGRLSSVTNGYDFQQLWFSTVTIRYQRLWLRKRLRFLTVTTLRLPFHHRPGYLLDVWFSRGYHPSPAGRILQSLGSPTVAIFNGYKFDRFAFPDKFYWRVSFTSEVPHRDRSVDRSTDRSIDRLIDRHIDRSIDWSIYRSIDRLIAEVSLLSMENKNLSQYSSMNGGNIWFLSSDNPANRHNSGARVLFHQHFLNNLTCSSLPWFD